MLASRSASYESPVDARELPRLSGRHLLGISELTREDILNVLVTAFRMRNGLLRRHRHSTLLNTGTVVNLFAENSTRTRSSFELAERALGANVLNFSTESSSFKKGETLLDTVKNIEAMHVDVVIVRHSAGLSPWFLAERCDSIFINAGDGRHEHPTQGLLDVMTLYEQWHDPLNPARSGFEGKKVTIVGDILHGRVALSNIYALQKLGAEVAVCGPRTLIPRGIEELGVRVFMKLEEAIEFSDALNMLRIQRERQDRGFFPSLEEYSRLFGLNHHRLRRSGKELLVLHPGPVNRGIELDSEVADGEYSLILKQVENGVAVRMATLAMLLADTVCRRAGRPDDDETGHRAGETAGATGRGATEAGVTGEGATGDGPTGDGGGISESTINEGEYADQR